MIRRLKYGNTNTFFIPGDSGGLLVDTDYAGSLPSFCRALKQNGIVLKDIRYILATHYHPDHCGLVGTLMRQGVNLLLFDVQKDSVHFPDAIFARDGLPYQPVDESLATLVSCSESRVFLSRLGISGEVVHAPSHSADSVSLILDSGECFAGDLEPMEYLAAYGDNPMLKRDWEHILSFRPKRIFYAHANEKTVEAPPPLPCLEKTELKTKQQLF